MFMHLLLSKNLRNKHWLPNLSQHFLQLRWAVFDFIRAISVPQFRRHCRTERHCPADKIELHDQEEVHFSRKRNASVKPILSGTAGHNAHNAVPLAHARFCVCRICLFTYQNSLACSQSTCWKNIVIKYPKSVKNDQRGEHTIAKQIA